jgi:hypothetical protein
VAADGTYTATIRRAPCTADGPFAVNVATTDAAGTRHCRPDADLVRALRWRSAWRRDTRSTRLRRRMASVITVRRCRGSRPGQRRGGDGCCERHLYRVHRSAALGRPAADGDLDGCGGQYTPRIRALLHGGPRRLLWRSRRGGRRQTTINAAEAADGIVITGYGGPAPPSGNGTWRRRLRERL